MTLVNEVADVLDNIAANPLHTPALYSGFLRALISAKLNNSASAPINSDEKQPSQGQPQFQQLDHDQGNPISGDLPAYSSSYGQDASLLLNEFQFNSEMGPVADISTFPPTMAPNPSEDAMMNGLTMENILSSGFWDSMLVPGKP